VVPAIAAQPQANAVPHGDHAVGGHDDPHQLGVWCTSPHLRQRA